MRSRTKIVRTVGCLLFCTQLALASRLAAEAEPTPAGVEGSAVGEEDRGGKREGSDGDASPLDKFGFGAAITVTVDYGAHDRVDEASLVNGVVRVSKERNVIARIMLETHYLFAPDSRFLGRGAAKEDYGWGPFFAVEPGGDGDLVDAVALGVLWSFSKGISDPGTPRVRDGQIRKAFNLGVGIVVDPKTKILGDGVEPDKPLPAGETEIRFKETDQWGVVVLFSVSI